VNKTILTVIIATVLMSTSVAKADHYHNSHGNQGASGIGIVAGPLYGFGIGFRHKFKSSPIGIQFGGFPLIKKDEGLFSAAAGFQFTLHTGSYGRAFLSLGGSVLHGYNGGMGALEENEDYTLWAVGPGIGMEFRLLDNFSVAIDVPAAAFFESNEGFIGMFPIPSVSFMFTW